MSPVPTAAAGRATGRVALRCLMVGVASIALAGCGGAGGDERQPRAAEPAAGNWNFEHGDFTGWHTLAFASGAWHVYRDGNRAPDPRNSDPHVPFEVPSPPEGRFAAVTDTQAAGARILHRILRVEPRSRLRMTLFYESVGGTFTSQASLDYATRVPNKQFRVELIDPRAPVTSMKQEDLLATIFRTRRGDPHAMRPREVTLDLSPFAGRAVRIRFAQIDNQGPLRAGVDDIRVEPAPRR